MRMRAHTAALLLVGTLPVAAGRFFTCRRAASLPPDPAPVFHSHTYLLIIMENRCAKAAPRRSMVPIFSFTGR
jgi:hypothetical protein